MSILRIALLEAVFAVYGAFGKMLIAPPSKARGRSHDAATIIMEALVCDCCPVGFCSLSRHPPSVDGFPATAYDAARPRQGQGCESHAKMT